MLRAPEGRHLVIGKSGAPYEITPFLIGQRFDLETKRVLGVAFDLVCNTLQTEDCDDYVKQAIATKIIELAKAGERNPDILCEKALEEICKPACCSQVSAGSAGGDAVNDALA
jgi:hypothetical protein